MKKRKCKNKQKNDIYNKNTREPESKSRMYAIEKKGKNLKYWYLIEGADILSSTIKLLFYLTWKDDGQKWAIYSQWIKY